MVCGGPASLVEKWLTPAPRRIPIHPAASALGARLAVRPLDDPVRPMFGAKVGLARLHPAADRDARLAHARWRARDERMPVEQVFALGDEPVGARHREPGEFANRGRRQSHAVGNPGVAALVIEAAAGLAVEQPAADVGEMNLAILVLELDEAAAAAAIAQALPFGEAHLVERLGPPEWLGLLVLRGHALWLKAFRCGRPQFRPRRPARARAWARALRSSLSQAALMRQSAISRRNGLSPPAARECGRSSGGARKAPVRKQT